jgi:hypothetical protein
VGDMKNLASPDEFNTDIASISKDGDDKSKIGDEIIRGFGVNIKPDIVYIINYEIFFMEFHNL